MFKTTPLRAPEGPRAGPGSTVPQPTVQRRNTDTPLPMRAIARGRLEFAPGTEISYTTLVSFMDEEDRRTQRYGPKAKQMVRNAFAFAHNLYEGEFRETKEGGVMGIGASRVPAISHPLVIAMRAVRFGQSKESICASLLHDTVEDGKAKPEEILALFDKCPAFESESERENSARRVLELVLLTTKPKYSSEGAWVFPDDPTYFQIEDLYDPKAEQYDQRSNAYYSRLLNTGDTDALFLKILDNIHNAETMRGIRNEKRKRNLRTMITHTLDGATLFLPKPDVTYLWNLFEMWGLKPPKACLNRHVPEDGIVFLPRRANFKAETWSCHPDPSKSMYFSVYGSPETIMADKGTIEVGLPSELATDHQSVLFDYLNPGDSTKFLVERRESRVSVSSPLHEEIFMVSGFSSPSNVIAPSDRDPTKIRVLDAGGSTLFELPNEVFSRGNFAPGGQLEPIMEIVRDEFKQFISALRQMFHDMIPQRTSVPPEPPTHG